MVGLEDEVAGIPSAGTASIKSMTANLTLPYNLPSSTTSDYFTSGWYNIKLLVGLEDEVAGIPSAGTASIKSMTTNLTLPYNLPSSTTSDYFTSGWYNIGICLKPWIITSRTIKEKTVATLHLYNQFENA